MKSLKDLNDELYDAVESGDVGPFVPTVYQGLNEKIHGFMPQKLYILAARPSMGKTAMMLDMAVGAAEEGALVNIYSVESSERELYERIFANTAGDKELLNSLTLNIDDNGGVLADQIAEDCAEYHPDIVMVDYVQLMKTGGEGLRTDQLGSLCSQLKSIAKASKCSMFMVSQLSRAVENRDNKRPVLADLRESGNLEQDADLVFMLYRPSYYYSDVEAVDDWRTELIIRKNRSGPIGTIFLDFDPHQMRFFEFD